MKRLATAVLLLSLLLPGLSGARAEEAGKLETDYFTVDVPDDWQVLQSTSANSISVTVLNTKARDAAVTLVVGQTGGAGLTKVTNCFARQYKATWGPTYRENLATFTFTDYEGEDATAFVSVQDALYMVIIASGNQNKDKKLVQNVRSENYPELVPR